MAEKTRADLQIVIDANLPDNTTDFITPLLHREVEEDLKDSNFNKLDDIAFDVNYPPTTVADWGATVPNETGEGLDILIKKVSTNASQNIAYVSETGSDTVNEFEVGNPLKPFLTINVAVLAVAGSNSSVVILGGSYTEDVVILNKSNFFLDAKNITLTGSIDFKNCNDIGADFTGSIVNTINDRCLDLLSGGNKVIKGGTFRSANANSVLLAVKTFFNGCRFESTSTGLCIDSLTECYMISCVATTTNQAYTIKDVTNCYFSLCSFKNTFTGGNAYQSRYFSRFYNCYFESDGIALRGLSSIGIKGRFVDCEVKSLSSDAVQLKGDVLLKIKGGSLSGAVNCVEINGPVRANGATTLFENVDMFCGSGVIFKEPASYNPLDLGVTLSYRNTYNQLEVPITFPLKLEVEQAIYRLGLQDI